MRSQSLISHPSVGMQADSSVVRSRPNQRRAPPLCFFCAALTPVSCEPQACRHQCAAAMAAALQRGVASYDAGFPVWALAWAHQVRLHCAWRRLRLAPPCAGADAHMSVRSQPAADELPTRLVACSLRPGARNYVQLLQARRQLASLAPRFVTAPQALRCVCTVLCLSPEASLSPQYDGEALASEHGMRMPVPAPAVAAEFAPKQVRGPPQVHRSLLAPTQLPRTLHHRRRSRPALTPRTQCWPQLVTRCACGASAKATQMTRSPPATRSAPPCAGCAPCSAHLRARVKPR